MQIRLLIVGSSSRTASLGAALATLGMQVLVATELAQESFWDNSHPELYLTPECVELEKAKVVCHLRVSERVASLLTQCTRIGARHRLSKMLGLDRADAYSATNKR